MRTQQAIVTTLLTVGLTSGAALLTGGCVDEYEQPKTVEPAPTEPMAPAPTPTEEPQAPPPAEEPQTPPADQPQTPPKPQTPPPMTEDAPAY